MLAGSAATALTHVPTPSSSPPPFTPTSAAHPHLRCSLAPALTPTSAAHPHLTLLRSLGLEHAVELKRNVSEAERRVLFQSASAIVYTPSYEHFGIVPLEAMAAARPVLAVGLGGPCESIVHGESGWLCEPTKHAFAAAYEELVSLHDGGMLEARGRAARERVKAHFSLDAFGEKLEAHVGELCGCAR